MKSYSNALAAGSTGWSPEEPQDFVSRSFLPMNEEKLAQTVYRAEAKDNVAHLILRIVVNEQTGERRICIIVCHIHSIHDNGGAVFELFLLILRIRS